MPQNNFRKAKHSHSTSLGQQEEYGSTEAWSTHIAEKLSHTQDAANNVYIKGIRNLQDVSQYNRVFSYRNILGTTVYDALHSKISLLRHQVTIGLILNRKKVVLFFV